MIKTLSMPLSPRAFAAAYSLFDLLLDGSDCFALSSHLHQPTQCSVRSIWSSLTDSHNQSQSKTTYRH